MIQYLLMILLKTRPNNLQALRGDKDMKRSKKPLTFTALAAAVGALSIAVEGCVYGPPPETNVYGPPPDDTTVESNEVDVYGPAPDETLDTDEVCVYGPAPDDSDIIDETDAEAPSSETSFDGMEEDVYGPPPEDIGD